MKLNIAFPNNGTMKVISVDDEAILRNFYDLRMSAEVEGDVLGPKWAGYKLRVSGGNDKQGFAMSQGILTNKRVRLLLDKNSKLYRPRRKGERKKKSVRGCIVGADLAVLNLVVTEVGPGVIEGLTDTQIPRRRGPKRVGNIRKLFNLTRDDDVTKFVIPREFERKGKTVTKRPKIQRLVTPQVLQRKRARAAVKRAAREKSKAAAAEYARLYAVRAAERRASRRSSRRSSRRE